ncbi:MAG: hypothetical protein PUP91_36315, partial [Rhizonema sp. PD37]|nr:hypothetical protein [Rhizonema sp. PD37]
MAFDVGIASLTKRKRFGTRCGKEPDYKHYLEKADTRSQPDLDKVAGISEVMVSRFRREKSDIGASRLIALLFAVPADARTWYLSELFGESPVV